MLRGDVVDAGGGGLARARHLEDAVALPGRLDDRAPRFILDQAVHRAAYGPEDALARGHESDARRLVVLTNENGSFYRYAYDLRDNVVGEQGFDGRVILYGFDGGDRLTERRELGVRTLFNILGPLTNPAGAANQLIGVFHADLVGILARVLQRLGRHVMVVHGMEGLDEISVSGDTLVGELKNDEVREYLINPKQFGMPVGSLSEIQVADSGESKEMMLAALANKPGPASDDPDAKVKHLLARLTIPASMMAKVEPIVGPSHFSDLGLHEHELWGIAVGPRGGAYAVYIDLNDRPRYALRCNCRDRDPCKHGYALLLTADRHFIPPVPPPDGHAEAARENYYSSWE